VRAAEEEEEEDEDRRVDVGPNIGLGLSAAAEEKGRRKRRNEGTVARERWRAQLSRRLLQSKVSRGADREREREGAGVHSQLRRTTADAKGEALGDRRRGGGEAGRGCGRRDDNGEGAERTVSAFP
jgi:hypothetical protein